MPFLSLLGAATPSAAVCMLQIGTLADNAYSLPRTRHPQGGLQYDPNVIKTLTVTALLEIGLELQFFNLNHTSGKRSYADDCLRLP
jgi:hypothetical protein